MDSEPHHSIRENAAARALPQTLAVARGRDWSINEYVCHAGPEDRPFEEQHDGFTVAAVVEGSFNYHSNSGRALLHAGTLLLGNHGRCFECGHEHSRGDRCVALHISPEYFREIAATAAGASRVEFPVSALPALPIFAPLSAELMVGGADSDLRQLWREETVSLFIANLLRRFSGLPSHGAPVATADMKRITRVISHLDAHAHEVQSLDTLAGLAAMSKFHFLRTFQKTTGVTPHKYVLGLRLRRAAARLRRTREPVSVIAFEEGFPDLSTFNRQFRGVFGQSPARYRKPAMGYRSAG